MRLACLTVLIAACAQEPPVDNRFLSVRLPRAEGATKLPADAWIVNLDRFGRCMVRGRWTAAAEEAGRIARTRRAHGEEQHVLLRVDERTPWRIARALYLPMARASHCRLHFATRSSQALLADLPGDRCCFPDGFWFGRALLIRASVVRHENRWMFRLGEREPIPLQRLRSDVELFVRNTGRDREFIIGHVRAPDDAPTAAAIALAGALRACGTDYIVFRPGWGPPATAFSYVCADVRHDGRLDWREAG